MTITSKFDGKSSAIIFRFQNSGIMVADDMKGSVNSAMTHKISAVMQL